MNLNLNKVTLLGRIVGDIIYKEGEKGKNNIAVVFLATNRKWKDKNGIKKEQATFHKVVFFGTIANIISQIGTTGEILLVEGRLQHKDIFDENKKLIRKDVSIVAEKFQLGTEMFDKDKPEESKMLKEESKILKIDWDDIDIDDI